MYLASRSAHAAPTPTAAASPTHLLQVRSAGASAAKDLLPTPNLDKHVFCRVLEDRGHVTVDDEG